ncbi:(2Fe-2S)-binding protein [Marinobacterium arenosum]|uniref:(2Fe-2S)-binding protein n=1 Tax=Marinobacterium arenosum TaxID=2862496 RepID=UPI001C93C3EF|nr:(2Fe-2S)-binding protein [Marinobacterium arenosum]MBY4675359.1 (2Fe-2S)-binding protein [Marinobacterium arenosum]
MFQDVSQRADRATVSITIDGVIHQVPEGYTVAAALLATGRNASRSTLVSGQSRGPYCLMGVCYECLVEVDGIPNRQGCMTEVRDGMAIRRQQGVGVVGQATEQQEVGDGR